MRRSILSLLVLISLIHIPVIGQSFRVNPTQVDVILSPGFNHLPIAVNILSNQPAFDINALEVTSDSAWVQPSVDVAAGKIVLTFATSNLINLSHTATLTARQGTSSNVFYVNGALIPLNVFKLVDDPVRSRVYGIHINGLERGNLLVIDPLTGNSIGSITVGRKPTDLAVSRDGSELFVLNTVDETISVVDLATLRITETISIPYDNWGPSDTTGDIAVGPTDIIYYTDGSWAPVLRVFRRSTGEVIQTAGIDGNGFGGFALTSDFQMLLGWAQYGWHAGWAGSYAARFTVDAEGKVTFAEKTDSNYPTSMGRDPLDTPVLVSTGNEAVFMKQFAFNSGALSPIVHSFPGPVYAISPGGEVASTASAIFETESGNSVYTLPVSSTVQVITSDYARLVYFDPQSRGIRTINLFSAIGPDILKRQLTPADGSIVLPPTRLVWQPLAGVDRYDLYLGIASNLVATATTNSPLFLGSVTTAEFFLQSPLSPGTTYYWRIDPVSQTEVVQWDIYRFTVSSMSSSTNEINVATIQGHRNSRASVDLQSEPAGQNWQAFADVPWISFVQTNGTTPATLDVILDASELPVGFNSGMVTLSDGTNSVFTIPVKLRVEALKLTLLESDPASAIVYGINEDPSNPAARAYLLEINTVTEGIERLIPVGNSVTDLAVHNGDGRIYVPNWATGSLLAVNKTNFVVERTYAFSPFGGIGYGDGDVFKVSAGAPGRLVVEEMDQWIDITIFDTINGTNIARAGVREGGGAFGGDGRYYYHGDNNSSGAAIHKFDVTGDVFTPLRSIRVESAGYYGSRTVVVSEDGQRVFWNGTVFNSDLVEEWTFGDLIYSTTPDGRFAFGQQKIYDVVRRQAILDMPAPSTVSAFNSTTDKLVTQVGGSIRFFQFDPTTLPEPTLSLVSVTGTSAVLAWTDTSLETGFTLQKRLAGDVTWINVATLPQNATSITINELNRESTYEFRIKADAPGLSSDWSNLLTVNTPGTPPTAPFLEVASVSTTVVVIQWANLAGGVDLSVERRLVEGPNVEWTTVYGPWQTISSYTDTNVTSGVGYEYRLKAANSWGSNYSNIQPVYVPLPSPPQPPDVIDAQVASATSIAVTWSGVADATGYILERRTDSPTSWIVLASLPAEARDYHDQQAFTGTEYWYRVAATNSIGRSAYSRVESVVLNLTSFACIVSDSFDPGLDPTVWAEIQGGNVQSGAGFTNGQALWFGTNTARYATTIPVPVSEGTTIEFKLRAGHESIDGTNFWNNSEQGEGVVLEYSTDAFRWITLQTFDTTFPKLSRWTQFAAQLSPNVWSSRTQFRWRQMKHSGAGFDTWAIDDICIRGNQAVSLTAPPFLTATAGSSTHVALFWFGSAGASHYIIERQTSGSTWAQVASTSSQQTYFTDTTAMPQTTYAYRVKAATTIAQSGYSPVALATTMSQAVDWLSRNAAEVDATLATRAADGVPNVLRYAFNISAQEPLYVLESAGNSGTPHLWFDPADQTLHAEFVQRTAESKPGITYAFEVSADLINWIAVPEPLESQSIDVIWERVHFSGAVGSNIQFARVVVRLE